MSQSAFLTITNLAANTVADFMLNADQGASNIRFIKRPSRVTFAMDATAFQAEYEVYSGGRNVVTRSAVDAGGTAANVPDLQAKAVSFLAAAGEILEFRVRETAGAGTVDLNLFIDVSP